MLTTDPFMGRQESQAACLVSYYEKGAHLAEPTTFPASSGEIYFMLLSRIWLCLTSHDSFPLQQIIGCK